MTNSVPSGDLVGIGAQLRDDNDSPVALAALVLSNSKTLSGNNTTVATPIFHVTGTVQVLALYGVITTALGANVTAAAWRLNDQTAQVNITLNTGTDISAAVVGSSLLKKGLAAAALTFNNASAGRVTEPTTLETVYFSPFVASQKTAGVTTDIEFVYATTDTPTSGAIQFFVQYLPVGSGSKVTAA